MTDRSPPLNWLRVFESAARFQSFARAAGELNMSAAAVSQQIRALEDRLGTPLFDRHAHAVTLTEKGRAYLPAVQQALVSLQYATEGLFGQMQDTRLFLQAVPLFAHGVLSRGIAEFGRQHPEIRISLASDEGAGGPAARYADLRVIFGPPGAGDGETERLLGERLFPVAAPDLAAQVAAPADLLTLPLIEVPLHRAGWPHLFESLGFVPRAARFIRTDNSLMAAGLAAEGAGVMLARAPASDAIVAASGLVPCLGGFAVDGAHSYHLSCAGVAALRRPARLFRDWLISRCALLEAGMARDGLNAPG